MSMYLHVSNVLRQFLGSRGTMSGPINRLLAIMKLLRSCITLWWELSRRHVHCPFGRTARIVFIISMRSTKNANSSRIQAGLAWQVFGLPPKLVPHHWICCKAQHRWWGSSDASTASVERTFKSSLSVAARHVDLFKRTTTKAYGFSTPSPIIKDEK